MTTDKYDLGYMEHIYKPLFKEEGSRIKAVLEIGVFQGDSIKEWHSHFPNAVVHGIDSGVVSVADVNPELVTVYSQVEAYAAETIAKFMQVRPEGYDLIIDDGPHTIDSQIYFVRNYGELLAEEGIMVLEDVIHAGALEKIESAVDKTNFEMIRYDMRGKQLSKDLLDRWQTGLDVIVLKKRKQSTIVIKAESAVEQPPTANHQSREKEGFKK